MFKARVLDIDYINNVIIVHSKDARTLGINTETRVIVSLQKEKVNRKFTVYPIITEELVNVGEIGVPASLARIYGVDENDVLEASPITQIRSIPLLRKKADGEKLSREEINVLVREIVDGVLDDAGLTMFLTLQQTIGMDEDELYHLIRAMVETGESITFDYPVYDEHSIGGVPGNSKVALLAVPTAVSLGLKIPKTSSRAIVSPSGTADTMEVLANVELSIDDIKKALEKAGGTLAWTGRILLSPADDILVRVERRLSIDPPSQVVASILSKKVAMGISGLVLDIPTGEGAKISNVDEAEKLAARFMSQTTKFGISFRALVTFGGEPIGFTIGPALEAREALETLIAGKGTPSLVDKAMSLAGALLEISGKAEIGEGIRLAREAFTKGKSYESFKKIIEAQGGNPDIRPDDIGLGDKSETIYSTMNGGIVSLDNRAFTAIARAAGAPHDKMAGVKLHVKIGYRVKQGDPLFTIYSTSSNRLHHAYELAKTLNPVKIGTMVLKSIPR